jgi:sterol desaturase/sphingolipid hydroxylase (fatty acid hydroxylase superfamily)
LKVHISAFGETHTEPPWRVRGQQQREEGIVLVLIALLFGCCLTLETLRPGWKLPHVRTWPARVLIVNGVQLGVVTVAGVTWERWLSAGSLLHLSKFVTPGVGGVVAYFIATFVFYWWHRWRHLPTP